jgi:chemotaxis protein methyltransferase CheR
MSNNYRLCTKIGRIGMTNTMTYEVFIERIYRKTGIDLSGYKRPQMERRINSLMRSVHIENYNDYLGLLDKDAEHLRKFIDHLTINVSEFFRNPNQWQVLEQKIIPMLIQNNLELKIWSAGCSTGEEPYTLAMVLHEKFPNLRVKITAVDIDIEVLRKAKLGIYNHRSLVSTPPNYIKKYFTQENSETYRVKDEIKQKINFKQMNLLKDQFEKNYDLIICRNVVIYFTEETKSVLYKRFYEALKTKGILFTGSTEQIFQARELGFESVATFFYQKV